MREWNSQTLMVMALIVLLDVIPTVTHIPLTYKLCQITLYIFPSIPCENKEDLDSQIIIMHL